MFDINTAINTAIATAVAEATRPLLERINALENIVAEYSPTLAKPAVQVDAAAAVEALNSQEWFWEKVGRFVAENGNITVEDLHMVQRRVTALEDARYQGALSRSDVEALVEAAINDHCETYDHDQYDEVYNEWGGEEASEFVKDSDIEDKINDTVNDILRNATFSISL
jgi:hypothetical protein